LALASTFALLATAVGCKKSNNSEETQLLTPHNNTVHFNC